MQPVHKNKPDSSGLVPGIFLGTGATGEMDGRNKSGHDGGVVELKKSRTPIEVSRTSKPGH